MLKNFFIFVLLFVTVLPVVVFAYSNPGNPSGFVNDFAGVLDAGQKQQLEQKLSDFEKNTGNEISIAVIKGIDGDTIENFAVKLFEDWGIGKEGKDNGALILVAVEDKQMRIEVGYGLEGALTDAQSFWIINNIITPAFKNSDFYGGLNGATDKIIAAVGGEKIPSEGISGSFNWRSSGSLDAIFFFIFILPLWLASILGRSKSWWAGGVLGGIAGIIIGLWNWSFYAGLAGFIILIPLGLLFDFIVSKTYSKSKSEGRVPPWWIGGGGFGGRSGGGGGFGGFGGGMSGGGGSSGRW